jgi:hypothetical protein
MKKMNLFGLAVIALTSIITTIMNGAVPPERPIHLVPRIRAGEEKAILPEPAARRIQEYLIRTIPIRFTSASQDYDVRIDIKELKSDSGIATVWLTAIAEAWENPLYPSTQILNLPRKPLKIRVTNMPQKWYGDIELSAHELENIKEIKFDAVTEGHRGGAAIYPKTCGSPKEIPYQ